MDETYLFGPFRLIRAQRLLLDEDRPVHLGSRALDILNVLIQAAGETVSNSEIMARAWPATIVEESSLRVHIGALRKALGESGGGNRYITNVPGRGYAFVAPVTCGTRPQVVKPPPIRPAAAGNLPRSLADIVGRDDTIKALREQLDRHRLVTIVGPGGIGKTTVAVAVAENAGIP
jgi:DNA-binding winged helix-turn-helix (wHTH) protein